jgi:tetratricopeptide (TPR) repeat protein
MERPRKRRPARGHPSPARGDRRPARSARRDRRTAPTPALSREVVEDVRAAAGGKGNRAVDLLAEAVDALDRGREGDAARLAQQAKTLAPRSGAVREVLGMALYRRGRFRDALRELQAYRRFTGRPDQNHLIADCHRALGAPEKALPLVREALDARIGAEARAEAAVVGGSALADLGRYEEALTLLRRFDRGEDAARPYDLRVWYVTGDVLERAGRVREAARAFRRVVDHDPEAFDAAERLSRLS